MIKPISQPERLVAQAQAAAAEFDNPLLGALWAYAIEQQVCHDNAVFLDFLAQLEEPPVDIVTFLESEQFLGATDIVLWPAVREAIIAINQDWWRGPAAAVREAILCGAIGTGKTFITTVTALYHLHLLACLKTPQALYGLPVSTSIVFVIQAAKPHVTKKIVYHPLRHYVETMPWFQTRLQPNKFIESEMIFENKNIRVVPGGGDADAILGEAVLFSLIDEANFMAVVSHSKKAEQHSVGGRSGHYDQAQTVYTAVTRRRKSRFTYQGPQIGLVMVASSTRYAGDFTDRRKDQVRAYQEPGVYIYDKAQYQVVPQERFSGETFRLLVGDEVLNSTRILAPEERVPVNATVVAIPVEYLPEFQKDLYGALRDIVGMASTSIAPFFRQRYKITECVLRGQEAGLASFLEQDNVVLGREGMPRVKLGHYCQNPSKPRYVHIDLSATQDRCAVSMLRYDGLIEVARLANDEQTATSEWLPTAAVEMACSIEPDSGHEIDIAEVRAWVKQLKDVYGYPIKVVSYDGFASLESRQQWRKQGMKTALISVDRTAVPYKQVRDAIYDGRLLLYEQPLLIEELFNLEYDAVHDKVDHDPLGSKDLVDSVTGAYYTLLTRRASWVDERALAVEPDRYEPDDRYEGSRF